MKHKILLVDAERRSVRVLGVALRGADYEVRVAGNGIEALEKVEATVPDVVVSDSQLPKLDGYALVEKLKGRRETAHVPIILLTSKGPAEDRERGRKLGVSDYLPKPVFVRELVACVGLLVARSARARIAACVSTARPGRFSGSTKDVSVVDLLQTFELLRESGVAHLLRGAEEATIHFRDGRAVDARLGRLRGEQAIYAALMWSEAAFDLEFKPVTKEDVIDRSTGTLLVEGMRRVDAWGRIYEQLRPLTALAEVDHVRLLEQVVSRLSDSKALSGDGGDALLQGLSIPSAVAGSAEPALTTPLAMESDEDEPAEDEAGSDEQDDQEDDGEERDDDAKAHDERDPRTTSEISPREAARTATTQGSVAALVPRRAHATANSPAPAGMHSPPANATATALHAVRTRAPQDPGSADDASSPARDEAVDVADEQSAPVLRGPRAEAQGPVVMAAVSASSSSPSSPPWTREVDLMAEDALDQDMPIPGVRSAMGRPGRLVLAASVAVAMLICIAAGLGALSARHERRADDARRHDALAAAALAPHLDPVALAPPVPNGETPSATAPPPAPLTEGEAAKEPMPPSYTGATPATSVSVEGETHHIRSALVAAAEQALVRGAIDHALVLAGQAVSAEPTDADAWLTLAAAHRASGDDTGARADYRNCIAHARTEAVSHCRVLAAH